VKWYLLFVEVVYNGAVLRYVTTKYKGKYLHLHFAARLPLLTFPIQVPMCRRTRMLAVLQLFVVFISFYVLLLTKYGLCF
jgi:hypothetical protein